MKGEGDPTQGTPDEASTVGIDLHCHQPSEEMTVEFYDCGGQVDYAGMHQVFMTRRALYLLVWDVTLFHNLDSKQIAKVGARRVCREAMAEDLALVRSKSPMGYPWVIRPDLDENILAMHQTINTSELKFDFLRLSMYFCLDDAWECRSSTRT